MYSIIAGSVILSILHAAIPNHWLPVIAIGKKEKWTLGEVTKVTFISAIAHGLSTIVIGIALSFLGAQLASDVEAFTKYIGPAILILLGVFFIFRHHFHHHFHLNTVDRKISKPKVIIALVLAMFLSPCMEIEAYFLLAGAKAVWLVWFIAVLYFVITTAGMVLLVRLAYIGVLRLNWHTLEHRAGIVTGITLVATGILAFFIH